MNKNKKKIVIGLLSLVVLFLIGVIGTQIWLTHKVRFLITNEIIKDKNYRVDIGYIGVGFWSKSLKIENIRIEPDEQIQKQDSLFDFFKIHLERFFVKGFQLKSFLQEGELIFDEVLFDSPDVVVSHYAGGAKKRVYYGSEGLERIKRIKAGAFVVKNANVEHHERKGEVVTSYLLQSFEGRVEQIDINLSGEDKEQPLSSKNIHFFAGRFSYQDADRAMLFQADTVIMDKAEGRLSVKSLHLLPQYSKQQFATIAGYDWIKIVTEGINCIGVDYESLFWENMLKMDSVVLQNVEIDSYKDRNITLPARKKPLFYLSLQHFPMKVYIPDISVRNLSAVYEELPEGKNRAGIVTINELSVGFSGLTNMLSAGRSYYELTAKGLLMDQGELQVSFRFPVNSSDTRFYAEGILGAMPLTAFNKVTEPLADLAINTGAIKSLRFHLEGDAISSSVNMQFLYNDLSVTLLKDNDGVNKERKIVSSIINTLLVRPDNPGKNGLRSISATAERDIFKSQFNYLWKSLLPGIKKTVIVASKKR